jgi:hypothetical protein
VACSETSLAAARVEARDPEKRMISDRPLSSRSVSGERM